MMDLDKFKPINDRHGHADGDRVLHNIGATIMAQVRTSDIVARYGGDEFVVSCPTPPPSRPSSSRSAWSSAILERRHELSDGSHVSVGVSAGLALYPTDGRTSAQLLAGSRRGDVRRQARRRPQDRAIRGPASRSSDDGPSRCG